MVAAFASSRRLVRRPWKLSFLPFVFFKNYVVYGEGGSRIISRELNKVNSEMWRFRERDRKQWWPWKSSRLCLWIGSSDIFSLIFRGLSDLVGMHYAGYLSQKCLQTLLFNG
ncbi:hypothetical protein SLEP1_g39538 [Rubroshorea leprosula]|uniref:Uncharacterized protein n=1 Tax=Rubroshorea leprosula TaxID=152421 RepID=A0AAV5L178_9ROSI|nr:hypothetical protein SLEP1_g39538 [Rubroshorea leprosula]